MLDRVISGGQSGCDHGALRAARACGLPTGEAMPAGFMTEDGPRPDLAEALGVVELEAADYPTRTRRNVDDSDGTLWFGDWHSRGARTTLDACRASGKPFLIVYANRTRPGEVVAWIEANRVRVLNVAGSRESTSPEIGSRTEAFLHRVFRQLARDCG